MSRDGNPPLLRRQQGAVLLILLTLIGLGAATLLINAMGGNGLQAARERRTVATLAQAREALLGFVLRNGRLPRPAASATDGLEMAEPCRSDEGCTGLLPWVALGVEGSDAWGKRLRYSVTPALTVPGADPGVVIATRTVRGRDGDGKLFYIAGQDGCTLQDECLPFVVLSDGKDNFGTSEQGVVMPNTSDTNDDEISNQKTSTDFIGRARSADTQADGGEFDDQLAWAAWPAFARRMKTARAALAAGANGQS